MAECHDREALMLVGTAADMGKLTVDGLGDYLSDVLSDMPGGPGTEELRRLAVQALGQIEILSSNLERLTDAAHSAREATDPKDCPGLGG